MCHFFYPNLVLWRLLCKIQKTQKTVNFWHKLPSSGSCSCQDFWLMNVHFKIILLSWASFLFVLLFWFVLLVFFVLFCWFFCFVLVGFFGLSFWKDLLLILSISVALIVQIVFLALLFCVSFPSQLAPNSIQTRWWVDTGVCQQSPGGKNSVCHLDAHELYL